MTLFIAYFLIIPFKCLTDIFIVKYSYSARWFIKFLQHNLIKLFNWLMALLLALGQINNSFQCLKNQISYIFRSAPAQSRPLRHLHTNHADATMLPPFATLQMRHRQQKQKQFSKRIKRQLQKQKQKNTEKRF